MHSMYVLSIGPKTAVVRRTVALVAATVASSRRRRPDRQNDSDSKAANAKSKQVSTSSGTFGEFSESIR